MRINFTDLSAPKRASKLLSRLLPEQKLSQVQEALASASGYRDWHDLTANSQTGVPIQDVSSDDENHLYESLATALGLDDSEVRTALSQARLISRPRAAAVLNLLPQYSPAEIKRVKGKVRALLEKAAIIGANDLHITVRESFAQIEFFYKGGIKLYERITKEEGIAYSFVLCREFDGIRPAQFLPGAFQEAELSGEEISRVGLNLVRIVSGPCFPVDRSCMFASARLTHANSPAHSRHTKHPEQTRLINGLKEERVVETDVNLLDLGYTAKQQDMLFQACEVPNGIILAVGSSGSGRTTLVHNMLRHAAFVYPGKRQIAVEHPVEYPMPWAVQLQGKSGTLDPVAEADRVMLRMGPEIIFLHELRTRDRVSTALNAALTGHVIFSTMSATDPYLAIEMLQLMGGSRFNQNIICDEKLLRCIVAQSLVPVLCPECAKPLHKNLDQVPRFRCEPLESYGDLSQMKIRGEGCRACDGGGYESWTVAAEVVLADAELMRDFRLHGFAEAGKRYRARASDNTMVGQAMTKVAAGLVDPRDVRRYVG